MNRRCLVLVLSVVLLFTLTACPNNPPKQPPPTIIIHKP